MCVIWFFGLFFVAANAHHIAHSNVSSYVDLFRIAHMPREIDREREKEIERETREEKEPEQQSGNSCNKFWNDMDYIRSRHI